MDKMTPEIAARIKPAIIKNANTFGIDIYDICGMIGVETYGSWDIDAEGDLTSALGPSEGLMQIGYVIACHDYGFQGTKQQLRSPENSIYYGCRHLHWTYDYLINHDLSLVQKYGPWYSAIVAYNCGVGNFEKGKWSAAYYVDKVIEKRNTYSAYGVVVNGVMVMEKAGDVPSVPTPEPIPDPVPSNKNALKDIDDWKSTLAERLKNDRAARPWPPSSDYQTEIGKTLYNTAITIRSVIDKINAWLGEIEYYTQPK